MTPLAGRFMTPVLTPYHDVEVNAYLEGFSPAGQATVATMTAQERSQFYEFFLLLRAISGAKAATAPKSNKLVVHGFKDCHLRCTYCIADMSAPTSDVLSLDTVRAVAEANAITSVHFIGGEPSYNWEHLFGVLKLLPFVRHVSLTTNGLGLTQSKVDQLFSVCPDVAFHLSLEPEAWGQRVFENGIHQNVALRKVMAKLNPAQIFRDHASCVNVVMPMNYGREAFHSDLTVDQVIAEISEVLGYDGWSGSWQIEGVLEGDDVREMPDWLVALHQTEVEYLLAADRGRRRFLQGPLGVRAMRPIAQLDNTGFPGTFFICTVGGRDMHLAHDGKAYTCSIEASRGAGGNSAPAESLSCADRWKGVCDVLPALANDVCRQCPARFVCGRTCGLPTKAACENTRLRADYTPRLLRAYAPEAFARYCAAQERFVNLFMTNRHVFGPLLQTREVRELCRGATTDLAALTGPLQALGGLLK